MSLKRFRKPTSSKPLYNQRTGGDISIPIPSNTRTSYMPSRKSPNYEDDDIIPLTGSSASSSSTSSSSRPNSFTMKTLNPRHLSLRLKRTSNPSSPSTPEHKPTDHRYTEPQANLGGGRAEFIYKPIHRTDYPAIVAETVAAQSRHVPVSRYQYHYVPSTRGARYTEEPVAPRSRTHYAHGRDEEDRLERRSRELYNDLDGGAPRGEWYASNESDIYTSAAEKRPSRAARRLTTVMVPDADEIYG
ncbi:hypothetical protein BJX70DRAFT_355784 [Aspergillus crustosus]